jgi:hypothetical protein
MQSTRLFLFILVIGTLLLSACGATSATPSPVGGNVEPIPVAFVGTIDSMAGDQWVINGQTVTVSPTVIHDGPFNVGDSIKVEGSVNTDGSFTVSRVEAPTPQETSTLPQFGNDNTSDSNTNDANINDTNSNDGNINDDNTNAVNTNDDNGNDDNGNDANSNDDNTNDVNTNDDNSNDGNGNDDNSNGDGGNSNDDNGNDDSGSGGNDNGGDDDGNGNDNDDNSND